MKQNCDGKNYQANPQVVCVKNEEDHENLPTGTDDEVEFYILQHQFDHSGMTSLSPFPTGVRMYTISFRRRRPLLLFSILLYMGLPVLRLRSRSRLKIYESSFFFVYCKFIFRRQMRNLETLWDIIPFPRVWHCVSRMCI